MGSGLFSAKGEGLKAFTLFEGVLMLVLGVLALIFPVLASAWITVIVAVGFLVGGTAKISAAHSQRLQHRQEPLGFRS